MYFCLQLLFANHCINKPHFQEHNGCNYACGHEGVYNVVMVFYQLTMLPYYIICIPVVITREQLGTYL